MAKVNLITLKNWFKTGLKPTQEQFFSTWDSFWHKDDKIPAESIENFDQYLSEKADEEKLINHINSNEAHANLLVNKVDKEEGKSLSTNDYTNDEKNKLQGIEENAEVNVPIIILDNNDLPIGNVSDILKLGKNLMFDNIEKKITVDTSNFLEVTGRLRQYSLTSRNINTNTSISSNETFMGNLFELNKLFRVKSLLKKANSFALTGEFPSFKFTGFLRPVNFKFGNTEDETVVLFTQNFNSSGLDNLDNDIDLSVFIRTNTLALGGQSNSEAIYFEPPIIDENGFF